jgi:hypothetical protein
MNEPTYSCTNGTHHLACDCREAQFAHLLVKYNAEVNENKRLKKELSISSAIHKSGCESSAGKDDAQGAIKKLLTLVEDADCMCILTSQEDCSQPDRNCSVCKAEMVERYIAARKELSELMLAKDERDVRLRDIVELQRQLAAKDAEIERMKIDIADRDTQIIELGGALFKRDADIARLQEQVRLEKTERVLVVNDNKHLREVEKAIDTELSEHIGEQDDVCKCEICKVLRKITPPPYRAKKDKMQCPEKVKVFPGMAITICPVCKLVIGAYEDEHTVTEYVKHPNARATSGHVVKRGKEDDNQ